jgi:Fungal specific transcription factor domain
MLPSKHPLWKKSFQDDSNAINFRHSTITVGASRLTYGIGPSPPIQQIPTSLASVTIPYSAISMYQQPGAKLFRSQEEFQYFRFFIDNTGPKLANNYASTLWDRLVLQTCEREPSIFHAVVALGALDASIKRAQSCIKPSYRVQQYRTDEHYRFSLNRYSTAVKQMRHAIETGKHDLRTALIASILLIAFETYHGNHEVAIDQIESSVQLLENWTAKPERSRDDRVSSPEPDTVEDELVQAFDRFDIECMIFKDKASVEHHRVRKDERTTAIQNMPDKFEDIDQAASFGKLISRRGWHFLCMVWSYDGVTPPPHPNQNLYDRMKANPTPLACAERNRYLEEVDRFDRAFKSLVNGIDVMKEKKAWLIAQCMQISLIGLRIGLETCFRKDEVSYDNFAPLFHEILSTSKAILNTHEDTFFIPTSQVALGLGVVAQKCRNPFIRREAITLLKTMARREMFCDSVILASICEWIVEVEEEGMVDYYVPEESRTRGVIITAEYRRHGMSLSCLLPKKGGLPGEMVKREGWINW